MTTDEKTAQEARALAGRLGLTQHLDTRLPMIESFLTTRESALRAEIEQIRAMKEDRAKLCDQLFDERDALAARLKRSESEAVEIIHDLTAHRERAEAQLAAIASHCGNSGTDDVVGLVSHVLIERRELQDDAIAAQERVKRLEEALTAIKDKAGSHTVVPHPHYEKASDDPGFAGIWEVAREALAAGAEESHNQAMESQDDD